MTRLPTMTARGAGAPGLAARTNPDGTRDNRMTGRMTGAGVGAATGAVIGNQQDSR